MNLRAALAAILLAAATLPACVSSSRAAEFRDVASGRYGAARASYEAHLAEGGAEETLDRNLAGTAALLQGDVEAAHRHFREAFDDMDDLTATAGETAAAFAVERTKRWKGDPHERAMNAWCLGVTYWMKGDVDNAAASFKAGLLRDADSEEGEAQSDFAALWFLLGMAQRDARHSDGGAQALSRAAAIDPSLRAPEGANVLVVLEAGFGPRKVPGGANGSTPVFQRASYVTAGAEVAADGRPLGRTVRATDIHNQAVTRGRKTLDTVNEVKGAVKDASVIGGAIVLDRADNAHERAVGLGLLAAGLLLPSEADVRHWDTLPGEIHVFAAKLPPGAHRLRVVPVDASGMPVAGLAREFDVQVREGRIAFVWTRAAPAGVVESGTSRTGAVR